MKKEKRNPPIAVLIPELLHSSFLFPQRGHFHTRAPQNKKGVVAFAFETNHSFTKLGREH